MSSVAQDSDAHEVALTYLRAPKAVPALRRHPPTPRRVLIHRGDVIRVDDVVLEEEESSAVVAAAANVVLKSRG